MELLIENEPPPSVSGEPGPFRDSDYMSLPEEWRGELLWGHLVVTPAPTCRHQVVLIALTRRLSDFALGQGHLLLVAPADVALFDHTVCQPDLLLVAGERRSIVGDRVEGAPDLVVEILSKQGGRRDRVTKLALYARARVPEYWLVDPESRTIELLTLEGGSYRIAQPNASRLRSERFPELELDPEALWDEVERMASGRRDP